MKKALLFILLCCFVASCSSPKKLYNKGKYNTAYKKALKELKKGKANREDKNIFEKAYRKLNALDLASIDENTASEDPEDWEAAWNTYNNIETRYLSGEKFLNASFKDDINKYFDEQDALKEKIYLHYKASGAEYLGGYQESYNKLAAQKAYYDLDKASFYASSQDEELEKMIEMSILFGTIIYSVSINHYEQRFDWEINNALRNMAERKKNVLRQIEIDRYDGSVDCQVDINMNTIRINEDQSYSDQNFTERIQDGFDTVIDTSGIANQVPRYINVSGSVRTYRITRNYEWGGNVSAFSAANFCRVNTGFIDARYSENIDTYESRGDERAIPLRFRNNGIQEDFSSEREIIDILLRELYSDLEGIFP